MPLWFVTRWCLTPGCVRCVVCLWPSVIQTPRRSVKSVNGSESIPRRHAHALVVRDEVVPVAGLREEDVVREECVRQSLAFEHERPARAEAEFDRIVRMFGERLPVCAVEAVADGDDAGETVLFGRQSDLLARDVGLDRDFCRSFHDLQSCQIKSIMFCAPASTALSDRLRADGWRAKGGKTDGCVFPASRTSCCWFLL